MLHILHAYLVSPDAKVLYPWQAALVLLVICLCLHQSVPLPSCVLILPASGDCSLGARYDERRPGLTAHVQVNNVMTCCR